MHIKIKSENVTALFPNTGSLSYDKIYQTLLNSLPEKLHIFTKRTPGSGYLQWDLPGEGWKSLSMADPLVSDAVRAEKERLFSQVMDAFASNIQLGQKVLTVPSDDYIFYRPDKEGGMEVKIAVWGYRNPSPVMDGPIIGRKKDKATLQETVVSFVYDGHRIPDYEFMIDGFSRVTDKDGCLRLGILPIGKSYELKLEGGRTTELSIVEGQKDYTIDVTVYVTLTVIVNRDGSPAADVACQISYWGHTATLTTAANGMATTTVPLDRKASECQVSVEDLIQKKLLTLSENLFRFDLVTPVKPEDIEVPASSDETEKPVEQEKPEEPSDERNQPKEPAELEEPKEPETPKDSSDPVGEEMDEPDKPVQASPEIRIRVEDENGLPMIGATILFEQKGRSSKTAQLDANGVTFLSIGEYAYGTPLNVTLTARGATLKPITFELVSGENEYLLKAIAKGGHSRWWELLAAIGGFVLTSGVFYIILQILI